MRRSGKGSDVPSDPSAGRRWNAKSRAVLVMRLLRGEISVEAAAGVHGLAEPTLERWRRRFLLGGESALRPNPRLEEALRESEERYRVLFDSGNDPILVYELGADHLPGKIIEANRVACEILGYPRHELLGLTALEIRSPEARGEFPELGRTLVADRHLRFDSVFRSRGGADIPVEVSARLIKVLGRPAVLSIARDVSERQKSEAMYRNAIKVFEEANRYKGELFANLNHELHTPLNTILGYTALLLEGVEGDLYPSQHRSVERVHQSASELLNRLDALLDLSAVESGGLELSVETFDPRDLVHAMVRTYGQRARRKGLTLEADLSEALPATVAGDRKRMQQVLAQLVDNAIKFTEAGGVRILARLEPGPRNGGSSQVHFVVEDSGIGVPVDRTEAIFRSFVQGDGSSTRTYGGVGLGLAIARYSAELLGGRVWVESAPRGGSAFHFTAAIGPMEQAVVSTLEEGEG